MRITLFRALQGIKIDDDRAAAVVAELEAHVESVVNNNIKAVEARLDGLLAMMDSLRAQMQFTSVMIGVVGVLISVVGLAIAAGPILAKFVH